MNTGPRAAALLATLAACCLLATRAPRVFADQIPPKLVVMLVVDQMSADYVEDFKGRWTGGLHRLVDRGAWFRKAAYPYMNTVTCTGHSTISTGALPITHGMILNSWWDRTAGRPMACTEDPGTRPVSYGGPVAGGGDSPWRLAVPTFTDELRAQKGEGPSILTFSLKPRSAVTLAGHAANAVTWFSDSGSWMTSSVYPGPVPFIADFVKAHPIEKDFGAVWTKVLPEKDYSYKDDAEGEPAPQTWTRTFPHVLKGTSDQPDALFYLLWEQSPFSDAYLEKLAEAAIDTQHLGQRGTTDYLGVSFSALDLVGHVFGPRSHEIHDMLARLDRTIGALLDHLDKVVGPDHYVVALTSDHGVAPIPEQLAREGRDAGRIDLSVIASRLEQALNASLGKGKYVSSVAFTDVYFEPGVYEQLLHKKEALKAAIEAIRNVPGVLQVFRSDELPALRSSKDRLQRAAALGYFPGRSGDLIVVPKPHWLLGSNAGTTHGTANDYDQRVPVILMGPGIKAGVYEQGASPADLAPTLASLVGIKLPKADGRVLQEAITAPMVPTPFGVRR